MCINLFGSVWARDTSWINRYVLNHERVHTAQMRELLWLPFYVLYVAEWLWRLLQYGSWHRAYMNISFEREAYANGNNLSYLKQRPPYAWTHYLLNKSPKKLQ